ncbi:hypothetical protein AVEN_232538-1 [Araneus ventricosus]|uniref:Uncharacterized protein n=1 Tax=Araneus ventricosus TaxID=182803 RepID=A0A4Y2KQ27_ARAVE|nr:hypothetical protein AVEN_232538-1 [Araneus ventricosus]
MGERTVKKHWFLFELFQKSLVKNHFNFASLPPTTAAAREHSVRAYLQVQLWSGFAKSPIDRGWKETKHRLFPATTYKESAPPALLSIISYKCAKGCNLTCTCRKSGIKYSSIAITAKGKGVPILQNMIISLQTQLTKRLKSILGRRR